MSDKEREVIAREAGWTPESEWDPEKPIPKGGFKTADEFIDDAAFMLRSANKKIDKLTNELKKTQAQVGQVQQDSRRASELVARDYQAREEALRVELEQAKQVAIAEGDSEAAIAAHERLNQLDSQRPPSAAQVDPAAKKAVDDWVVANPWYTQNPALRQVADQIGRRIEAEGVVPPGPARLAAVEAEVRRLYPDQLSSDQVLGGVPGNAEGARGTTQKTSGRTFDDLPQEAQDAFHRMKQTNSALTKPQYLSQYEWE